MNAKIKAVPLDAAGFSRWIASQPRHIQTYDLVDLLSDGPLDDEEESIDLRVRVSKTLAERLKARAAANGRTQVAEHHACLTAALGLETGLKTTNIELTRICLAISDVLARLDSERDDAPEADEIEALAGATREFLQRMLLSIRHSSAQDEDSSVHLTTAIVNASINKDPIDPFAVQSLTAEILTGRE